jgi:chromosome segregation ATPase
MADREYKYYAFLSLSAQDNGETPADSSVAVRRRWGNWLDDALKTFSIPPEFVGQINGRGEIIPERIAPVFVDQSELPGDSPLSPEIRQALEESLCLIVVCSPHSAQSRQVNEVVRYFKQLGRANWILPFVVAGEPNPDPAKNGEPFPADECFVPALRHPVQLDGTLDTGRRAGRHLFVDARYGATKHEILAQDDRHAEADLEMAKIQLISLLVGVGFNGLWQREQERHFFDLAEARSRAREALDEVEKIRCQLQEAQRQADEAGKQSQALQNLPHDLQGQIQETQNQALTARNQARAAEQQLQEFQNKIRETEAQLEVARSRASAAESKVLETQQQARETQNQLEAGLIQAFAAQKEALAIQNRTQEGQIQDVQNQLLKAQLETQDLQSQLAEVRRQAQDAQEKLSAAQNIVQEFQDQLQLAKSQLEEARLQVREAEDKSAMLQVQARVAQKEALESLSREQESRNQDAQNQILKAQLETQNVQSQLEEVRRQARDAQDKLLATQNTVQEFQGRLQLALGQLEEARLQVREAENQSSAAQVQTRQAQDQVQEIQSQARDTESQFAAAQIQVQKILHQRQNARRLTRAFAVLAVLASLAAAVVARNAWHQRQTDNQALATADAEASGTFDLTSVAESSLRQALQKVGGAEQSENRRRSLDRLAVLVPLGEIPGDLKAAAIIADAQQRNHF